MNSKGYHDNLLLPLSEEDVEGSSHDSADQTVAQVLSSLKFSTPRQHPVQTQLLPINEREPIFHHRRHIQSSYLFKHKLGRGTYGVVHAAVEKQTGFTRAVKKIPKRGTMNLDRFRQEMEILQRIDHPRIIRVHETFEDYASLYLVMEYCGGGELFDFLRNEESLPEIAVAFLMKQILSAIAHCHSYGIAHRDIKPENFLFSEPDFRSPLKLADFGLAKFLKPADPLKTMVGTAYYVAPEIANREEYDTKVDLWSAGIIMYIMLFNRYPYGHQATSDIEVLEQIRNGSMDFNRFSHRKISDRAIDLISSLCRRDPRERLEAVDALDHPWIDALCPSPMMYIPVLLGYNRICNIHARLRQEECKRRDESTSTHLSTQESLGSWMSTPHLQRCASGTLFAPELTSFCCGLSEVCGVHSTSCSHFPGRQKYRSPNLYLCSSELSTPDFVWSRVVSALSKAGLVVESEAEQLGIRLLQRWAIYSQMSVFKKGVIRHLAERLEHDSRELAYLRILFDLFDVRKLGWITCQDLTDGLCRLLKAQNLAKICQHRLAGNRANSFTETGASAFWTDCRHKEPNKEVLKSIFWEDTTGLELLKALDNLNKGSSGSYASISTMCSSTTSSKLPTRVHDIVCGIDLNQNGKIEYLEFLSACLDPRTYLSHRAIDHMFCVLDRDGDNKISYNEFLQCMGWNDPYEEKVAQIFRECDRDMDGSIDLEEFAAVIELSHNPSDGAAELSSASRLFPTHLADQQCQQTPTAPLLSSKSEDCFDFSKIGRIMSEHVMTATQE